MALAMAFVASTGVAGAKPEEDKAADKVWQAIKHHHLTSLKEDCFVISTKDVPASGRFITFDAREVHNKRCGGDPETDRLRMFSIRYNRKTGAMTTDAHSPGEFVPLK
jgi:hypothetical protein